MKKNMYSLMLAEEVVQAIDRLASEKGTNRSNLINQSLAEYVSLTTPEKHVSNIFDFIENTIGKMDGFLLYSQPNDMTMSIKSSLKYHYRPTIRYEVEMYRMPDSTIESGRYLYQTLFPERRDPLRDRKRQVFAYVCRPERFGIYGRTDRKRDQQLYSDLRRDAERFSRR